MQKSASSILTARHGFRLVFTRKIPIFASSYVTISQTKFSDSPPFVVKRGAVFYLPGRARSSHRVPRPQTALHTTVRQCCRLAAGHRKSSGIGRVLMAYPNRLFHTAALRFPFKVNLADHTVAFRAADVVFIAPDNRSFGLTERHHAAAMRTGGYNAGYITVFQYLHRREGF